VLPLSGYRRPRRTTSVRQDSHRPAPASVARLDEPCSPHRTTLRALIPVLIADPENGVFAEGTAFSRVRVQRAFEDAVAGAADAPKAPIAGALGRLLYLVHLAVLLWWLLDRTPKQRATAALVALTEQMLPSAALTLRLPPIRRFVLTMDELIRDGLIGNPAAQQSP